jgi:hypothetical protein
MQTQDLTTNQKACKFELVKVKSQTLAAGCFYSSAGILMTAKRATRQSIIPTKAKRDEEDNHGHVLRDSFYMVVSAVEESGKSHGKGEKPRTAKDNITRPRRVSFWTVLRGARSSRSVCQ